MAVNSRKKGHTFERAIAKLMNDKYHIKKDKDKWKRVPLSGGFDKENFPGDIYTMSPELNQPGKIASRFSIECKFHKDWKLEDIIHGKGKILDWWKQASDDATGAGKLPLLVFKKNQSPIYFIASPESICRYLREGNLLSCVIIRDPKQQLMTMGLFEEMLNLIFMHDKGIPADSWGQL